jgi:hypothetical protein
MSELLAEPRNGESLDRLGPTAIVSYLNILVFALTAGAVFYLLVAGIEPPAVMAGVLGTVLGASGTALGTTNQFWLGGNIGVKSATTALKQLATTPTVTAPAATTQQVTVTPPNVAPPPGPDDADGFIPPHPGAPPRE